MGRGRHHLTTAWVTTLVLLVVVAVGGTLYGLRQRPGAPTQVGGTGAATPSPFASPAQLFSQPAPTPSPTAASELPDSAKSFLANFYASYKARDRSRLATFFTPDITADDRLHHSTLFNGADLQGNPGGPTLFSTNSAIQSASEYFLLSSQRQGSTWQVTVRERRVNGLAQPVGEATTLLTLVPGASSSGPWLLDSYVHTGSTGKYEGFLLE